MPAATAKKRPTKTPKKRAIITTPKFFRPFQGLLNVIPLIPRHAVGWKPSAHAGAEAQRREFWTQTYNS